MGRGQSYWTLSEIYINVISSLRWNIRLVHDENGLEFSLDIRLGLGTINSVCVASSEILGVDSTYM